MSECCILLHGGAFSCDTVDYEAELSFLRELVVVQIDAIINGKSALEVVQSSLQEMERSGLFVAGSGSSPNADGAYVLDACIMDGTNEISGGVAGVSGFKYPSEIALNVLRHEKEALWIGSGAEQLARKYNCQPITEPEHWYRPRFRDGDNQMTSGFGTVGAVVRDRFGNLAGGTSTGGLFAKHSGRVGDTPIVGAGTWADSRVAISCTGDGQAFLRANAASYAAFRQEAFLEPLGHSLDSSLSKVKRFNGLGAMIALSSSGEFAVKHNTSGVKVAGGYTSGRVFSGLGR